MSNLLEKSASADCDPFVDSSLGKWASIPPLCTVRENSGSLAGVVADACQSRPFLPDRTFATRRTLREQGAPQSKDYCKFSNDKCTVASHSPSSFCIFQSPKLISHFFDRRKVPLGKRHLLKSATAPFTDFQCGDDCESCRDCLTILPAYELHCFWLGNEPPKSR